MYLGADLYDIPEDSYETLQSYLMRIKKYIDENHLDHSVYEEIEKRIGKRFTFLSQNHKSISKANVLSIIDEIGEPEVIFRRDGMGQYCTCPNLKSKLRQKPYRNSKE
jgi:hypothetical protein